MTPDLDELERMVAEATPGPWRVYGKAVPYSRRQKSPFDDCGAGIMADDVHIIIGGEQDEQGGAVGILRNEDARLIATVVNALPALIERVRRAEEALKPLAEAYIGGWALPLRGADAIVSVTVQDALTARAHFAAYRKETDNGA